MSNQIFADRYARASELGPARPRSSVLSLALSDDAAPFAVSLAAFVLLLAVGLVHIEDQGGFIGNVTPLYMAVGYYFVEIAAAITIPLILRKRTGAWALAALVSIGPCIAYIFSRTIGLPGDPGDVGNWGYELGTVSLIAEGTLFVLSTVCLLRAVSAWRRAGR